MYVHYQKKEAKVKSARVWLTPMLLRRGDLTGSVSVFMESMGDW